MIIEVTTRDEEGSIAFTGKLNKEEISFVLNVGINYLLAEGAMPMFIGKEEDDPSVYAPSTKKKQ